MDDPAWVWPAWKFGMKRDDLFTTLHDQYNTFSYTLQDPEAFHHDVYEVSHLADTPEDFHRFMADRQRQRITELRESLESLAVEIIANPKLMGTDQWQHALQLFQTKSFDSIVRYFASYIPEENLERYSARSITSSRSSYSSDDSISTQASSAGDDVTTPFLDDFFEDGSRMIEEPCSIDVDDEYSGIFDSESSHLKGPDNARFGPACSHTGPSPQTMSYCVSDCDSSFSRRPRREDDVDDDEETCPSDDCDTAAASVCDSAETSTSCDTIDMGSLDSVESLHLRVVGDEEELPGSQDDDEFPAAQYPEDDFCTLEIRDAFVFHDTLDSDTPTPTQTRQTSTPSNEHQSISIPWVSAESYPPQALLSPRSRHRRSCSPRCYLARQRAERCYARDRTRSPEEACSKIRKSRSSSPIRRRPKGRCSRSSSASGRRLD